MNLMLFADMTGDLANFLVKGVASTIVFTLVGLTFFAIAFQIIVRFTPFSIRKEIEEDQNVALAIIIGAVIIWMAMIVSAALHG